MTMVSWIDIIVPALLVVASLALSPFASGLAALARRRSKHLSLLVRLDTEELLQASQDAQQQQQRSGGYILPVQIHHARILPKESQHQFRYPSIFLALNLREMESGGTELNKVFHWSPLAKQEKTPSRSWWKRRWNWSLTRLDPEGFGRRSFVGLTADVQSRLSESMLLKLMYELRLRGYTSTGPQDSAADPSKANDGKEPWSKEVGQVWAVAMPSLLGMGGFNPLTIYYVYRPQKHGDGGSCDKTAEHDTTGQLWLVVLEVHNTFNERHVYICQVGVREDDNREVTQRRGYQHSWTFPRAFHVSPFNDRSGYYQLFIGDLWSDAEGGAGVPTLDVRLLLLVDEEEKVDDLIDDEDQEWRDSPEPGELKLRKKLLATLTSSQAKSSSIRPHRRARPLTSMNMLKALSSQPLDLILPVSRIMIQAAKLHWKRRLPVFIRPELQGQGLGNEHQEKEGKAIKGAPYDGVGWPVDLNPTQPKEYKSSDSGSIYWNQDGFIEQQCRRQFDRYVCHQTGKNPDCLVSIVSRNVEEAATFYYNGRKYREKPPKLAGGSSSSSNDNVQYLTIYTLSSSLYLDFATYTPAQAHLFGSRVDRNWGVSSMESFNHLFQLDRSRSPEREHVTRKGRIAARARREHLRWSIASSNPNLTDDDLRQKVAQQLSDDIALHPYDSSDIPLSFLWALLLQLFVIRLTAAVSGWLHIRYVRQPWAQVGEGFQILCAETH
jgi:DUF1365 family protein